MKKLSVVLMTGIMAASMAAAAYAKDEPAGKFEKIGIHMTLPEEMSEVKGVFDPEFYGAISDDPEIYYMGVAYFAMPQEKLEYYQNLPEEDFTEEVSEEISGLQTLICEIFAVQGDSGDFYKMLGMEENTEEIGLEELGKSDEFTFFCIPTDGAQYLTNADESFIEEYQTVYDMTMNALRNAAFEDPSTSFAGKTAAFKSTDLERFTAGCRKRAAGSWGSCRIRRVRRKPKESWRRTGQIIRWSFSQRIWNLLVI